MASSSEPAPTKRPRTDSDEPVTFTRSDLWWEDGNIVIQAETTQFRVYKGHLATHSEIFRDMFSIPQPSMDPKETVEGCPVVQVSDTAEDWTYILQALLERRYTTVPLKPVVFEVVAAFLRLGLKYNVEMLKTEAIGRLTHEFPTSLEAYDNNVNTKTPSRLITVKQDDLAVRAINLARECDCIDFILPTAFYSVISLPDFHKAIQGLALTPEDRMIAVYGFSRAAKYQYLGTMRWLISHDDPEDDSIRELYDACMDETHCSRGRSLLIHTRFMPIQMISGLSSWAEWERWFARPEAISMCPNCLDAAQGSHNSGRDDFWHDLPLICGLTRWDDLLKQN